MTIATLLIALTTISASNTASGEPMMLDFTATWCGPCKQVRPTVEQLIQNGYRIRAVDIDNNQDLAAQYEVTRVPTFVVIDPTTGEDLGRIEGPQPPAPF